MSENIGNLSKYKTAIDKVRALTVFLYMHHSCLAMMRKYTNRREFIRPGVTRFTTTFLSFSCLLDKKSQLATVVSSSK